MDLSFFPLTLEAIDQAAAESLCLFIASDERPLTGLAGLCDWRLSGRLSRLLRNGLLTGDAGEAVLTPPGSRMAFQKLFLFGVGRLDQTEEQLTGRVAEALRKLAQAGVQEAAMQLPARLSAEAGIRTLVDELQGPGRAMVFAADPQKLVAALSQAATRGQANLERRVVKVAAAPAKAPPVRVQPPPARPQPAIPKASPLPFAPQEHRAPVAQPEPPIAPVAEPVAPLPEPQSRTLPEGVRAAEPLPTAPTPEPPLTVAASGARKMPVEPAKAATPPPAAPLPDKPVEERKPAPPPAQKYVPPPPKPHVFDSRKGKHKKP